MAGKENPQPKLNTADRKYFANLDKKSKFHFENNKFVEKLPKFIEEFEKRGLGRPIEALFLDRDGEDVVASEKVGYVLPSKTDEKGRVSESVALLKNGLILVMKPSLAREKQKEDFHKEFSPTTWPLEIDLEQGREENKMEDVARLLKEDAKIISSSDNELQVEGALDALDQASVFAWNLKESKMRSLQKSAKEAGTIFERFLKTYDSESLDIDPTE